jgi:translocation and assembly module TamA
MHGRGGISQAAGLFARTFVLLCPAHSLPAAALAQSSDSAELDPSAPLDPLPGLGVDWPELDSAPPEPLAEPGPGAAAPPALDAPGAAPAVQAGAERRYAVRLAGLEPLGSADPVSDAFLAASVLHANRDDPANAAQIERRIGADADLLAELLRSRGYYDVEVRPQVEAAGGGEALVTLTAVPGPLYRFASVELPGLDAAGASAASLRRAFAVEPGEPVVAEEVLAGELALRVALGEEGFAQAAVGDRQVEIDPETHTASLVLPVEPGPVARFGSIRVSGRPAFPPSHLATLARFRPGERFQRSKVDDLRRALVATGLVSGAEVTLQPGAGGTMDLAVRLEPAPPRTVAGELGYGTGEGLRAEASWQHRNLVNPEGALTLRGVAGTREQLGAVEFRRNNFRARDAVLTLNALASKVDRDAYEARTVQLGAGFERQSNIIWQKRWTWGVGLDVIATNERGVFQDLSDKQTRTFRIGALSAHLRYDGTDDLLDPTTGFRLGARASAEHSWLGESFTYTRIQLDGSAYRPLGGNTVLAGRVRLGTIVGAQSADLAPSRRFYSGGGGSVRGYGYQRLGPRDADGDPTGGRALAEFALEARVRLSSFGGNFAVVPFVDGGTLSTGTTPDLGSMQFGAGLGLRYHSSFGPIRIDLGTPLNRQRGDPRVAVVVSLGQAF